MKPQDFLVILGVILAAFIIFFANSKAGKPKVPRGRQEQWRLSEDAAHTDTSQKHDITGLQSETQQAFEPSSP